MHKKISPKIIPLFLAVFIVVFAMTFALFQRTALANFVVNAWQGYRLNSGLVGYWSFDGKDISGTTAYDRSGQGNNGTLTNGPAATIGKIGQAFNFFPNGSDTNAYANMGDPVSGMLDFGTGDFSVGFWMKGTGYSSQGSSVNVALAKKSYNSVGTGYGFSYGSGNILAFTIANGTTAYSANDVSATMNDNTWHHYVGMRSGGMMSLYRDGMVRGTNATVSGSCSTASGLIIGADSALDGGRNANVIVDDVRIYSRALSPEEVQRLYLMGASLKTNVTHRDELTSGLVGEWTFDGKDMIPNVRDVSGQGNHGGLQNQNPTTTTIGKIGQGLSFDGVDDSINLGDVAVVDTAATLSSCAWVKHDVLTSDDGIISKITAGAADGFVFFRDDVGSVSGRTDTYSIVISDSTDTSTARIEGATGASQANVWTHVCFTFETSGTGLRLYINGVEDANSPVSTVTIAAINGGSQALEIGNNSLGALFSGAIDETRIYTRVLSADEIKRLYLMGASFKTNVTHRDELTSSGLVGEWTFDGKDMTPNVRDVSGQGNHGGLQNQNPTTTTIGKIGQGLSFDGVDDYVSVANNASLNIGTSDVTFSAWIKPANTTAIRGIIIKRNTASPYQQYDFTTGYVNSSGSFVASKKIGCFLYSGGLLNTTNAQSAYTTNDVADGNWHFVQCVRQNGSSLMMYVDGVSVPVTYVFNGTTNVNPDSTAPVYIGALAASSSFFDGPIDDVRIYNRALSADEIQRLYLMGK
ncbi:MAG: hypothetical protein A2845_00070 [Candidatus Lloydbacteria bacterium RIFCSPHIGHO2_01_FULL_49_22]|uniref:Laminin G domain-containing protein n=1 Tax=Candidatus Lloydbacteria bacterium RIFCSPHIGHO2_01_FULL_49_22 TaxID=1798658 RepID=A0A1G2CU34_9BACT|nr:MAG: hypothetical protein A2845_00070 [Candidatus Lloydbacteria bacterium RIFCSPHIGHO2_01_FULL_49_22]